MRTTHSINDIILSNGAVPRQASSLRDVEVPTDGSLGSHSKCAIAPKPELSAFVNAERKMHTHDGRSKHMHPSSHALQAHDFRDLDPSYLSSHDERKRTAAANSIRSPWQSMGTESYLARPRLAGGRMGCSNRAAETPVQTSIARLQGLSSALLRLCSCTLVIACARAGPEHDLPLFPNAGHDCAK